MGSGNKHVFLRLYPLITRQRKKGEFLGFFPKECMGIIRYISTVADRFMKVTFSNESPMFGYIQTYMSLYYSALKQSSALNFAPGIYLSEYYLRCKYEC